MYKDLYKDKVPSLTKNKVENNSLKSMKKTFW